MQKLLTIESNESPGAFFLLTASFAFVLCPCLSIFCILGVDYVPDDHCEGDDLGFKCLDNYVAVEFDTRDCLTDKIRIHTKKSGEDPVVEQWDPGCNFIQLEDGAFRYAFIILGREHLA